MSTGDTGTIDINDWADIIIEPIDGSLIGMFCGYGGALMILESMIENGFISADLKKEDTEKVILDMIRFLRFKYKTFHPPISDNDCSHH